MKQIYEKRNRLLFLRDKGGLGDIFMHRMLFEDVKLLIPECEITFACPIQYHQAVIDHPFIDHVIDSKNVDISKYGACFDTSDACNRYEISHAPYIDKHRSDIWADHCGFTLTNHQMHFRLSEKEKQYSLKSPSVVFAPISAMGGKSLDAKQIQEVIDELQGYNVYILHNQKINVKNCEQLDCDLRHFISAVYSADYVISVDTAALHCAGGLGKPLVGIFSWTDGKIYGKYYKMELVQFHRDDGWDCGPCYNFVKCPKETSLSVLRKPCITKITSKHILDGFQKIRTNI